MMCRERERGATLLDAVVGTALMLIVFVGIASAFRLTVQAVGNNSARAGAIALANERLEYIRSLAYDSVGTVGGIPAGDLEQEESLSLNNIPYTRRTFISYEDDPGDGLSAVDENGIVTDYKAVKTDVSWESRQGTRTITMIARLSPVGVEQEVPGGTLAIHVVNDTGEPVSDAIVTIVNTTTDPTINTTTYTDAEGDAVLLGAPAGADYEVTVTKSGYTTAQTYSADTTNTNPVPAHVAVALNTTTAVDFEIDLLSDLTVYTYEPVEEEIWNDSFANASGLSIQDSIEVVGGALSLASGEEGYEPLGTARSASVTSAYLYRWNELSWSHTVPAGTDALYRVYVGSGSLVPDIDLPGNSTGFSSSPVSLAGLSTTTYPELQIGVELSTNDTEETPSVESWDVVYETGPTPLPDIEFDMRGVKTIGSGPGGPVYKIDQSYFTDDFGEASLLSLEYDTYTLSMPTGSGYDISSSCPPQPMVVAPGASALAQLFLVPHTSNSLLVDVQTSSGILVVGMDVRLQRDSYDETIATDACGQSFFSGIAASSGTPYTVTVGPAGAPEYVSNEVSVTGTTQFSVLLSE